MNLQWLFDRFIAHRGLHDGGEGENTLDAYRAAIDNGYNIELDVQLTKDNVPVVFHDIHLGRLTGCDSYVRHITYRQLTEVRYLKTGKRIPTFDEALAVCEGKTGVMVELKDDDFYTADCVLEERVAPILDNYRGEYVVKSFNPFSVDWFRRTRPHVPAGLLSADPNLESISVRLRPTVDELLFGARRVRFFDYAVGLLRSPLADKIRASGMPVIAWTVRDQSTYGAVKSLCDNIIFEEFRPVKIE